jgi:hypothetical protein
VTIVYLLILAALIGAPLGLLRYRRRRFLLRAVPKDFDPVRYGLAPSALLDPRKAGPDVPDDHAGERDAVIEAARKGDWEPAAAYVEGAGQDYDERWSRTQLLQQLADRTPQWLGAWLQAQPQNGDALSVHASLLVHQAWAARGTGYANQLSARSNRVNRTEAAHVTSWSAAARATLLQVARSLDQVAEDDGRVQRLRHKLAFYLCNARHYDAALDQFRRLGPWCGAEPWNEQVNTVARFELARATAAVRAAGSA